jgi:cytochrome c556
MRNSGWLVLGAVMLLGLSVAANEKPSAAYSQAMKDIQSAQGAMRTAVTAKDYDAIAKAAATFKASFDTAEAFWTAKKADDAIAASKAGVKGATDLAAAAAAKNDEGIAAAQRAVGATCAGCHMAHRERLADGTFEIK